MEIFICEQTTNTDKADKVLVWDAQYWFGSREEQTAPSSQAVTVTASPKDQLFQFQTIYLSIT